MPSQWRETIYEHFETLAAGLNTYTVKAWAVTALATVLGLVVIGLPTAIYENPFFVRMTRPGARAATRWCV